MTFSCAKHFNDSAPIFGDVWTLLIVANLGDVEKRFGELQRDLRNVSPVTLSNRLKKLEALEIITRSTETIDKLSVTYRLTEKGHDMLPALREINTFTRKHFSDANCTE